jgi:hypothetical protein
MYAATGDASTLAEAERSARWGNTHRSLAGGGCASDQTSDLACRRKVGVFDITIRK